jgi:ankyrin repeat protein
LCLQTNNDRENAIHSCIYWAARQGQLDVIKYLKEENVSLDTQNRVNIF